MQVTETLSDGLKRGFSVLVTAAEIASKTDKKLAEMSRTMRLPGFRPGKVPQALVRQRYGRDVMAEIMQTELNEATDRVMSERGLRPAGRPKVDVTGEIKIDGKNAQDLAFTVELEILPDITLPDLSGLSLTRVRADVPAEQIESSLTNLAKMRAAKVPVTEDRGAETGDVLTVDFVGTKDGVEFEGGKGTDSDVEIGASGFIPGFAEGMIGMKPGESRVIDVTFPENYHSAELAGKAALFNVTAKALSVREAAPVDDALADTLGMGTLEELKTFVTGMLQRELDQTARLRIKRELLDKLADVANFPAPQNLVEAEFAGIWQRVEADRAAGQLDEEDRSKDPETLRAEYRGIAERRVRLGLLLAEIGRVNNIVVSEPEMNRALQAELQRYPGQEQQVLNFFRQNPGAIEQIRGPIFEDKVVDFIIAGAAVTDQTVSVEELNAGLDAPVPGIAVDVPAEALDAPVQDEVQE
jgi:trigger factor